MSLCRQITRTLCPHTATGKSCSSWGYSHGTCQLADPSRQAVGGYCGVKGTWAPSPMTVPWPSAVSCPTTAVRPSTMPSSLPDHPLLNIQSRLRNYPSKHIKHRDIISPTCICHARPHPNPQTVHESCASLSAVNVGTLWQTIRTASWRSACL